MKLLQGDCFEVMQSLEDNSVDLVLTDPPYGLKFMGKKWDYEVPSVEIWAEALRVLKPGGHLLAFSGDRTYHRMACNVEDADFEVRAMAVWVYGSGYPKSKNHLKPSIEPIVMARKQVVGTTQKNIESFGVGGLNINDCRIGGTGGRWPANLIHDGSEEVVNLFPTTKSGFAEVGTGRGGNHTRGIYGAKASKIATCYADEGSASRFFYCAKASKKERNQGLDSTRTVKYDIDRQLIGDLPCLKVATVLVQLLRKATFGSGLKWSIGESGESITGRFRSECLSTIKTKISEITESKILSLLTHSHISESIADANYGMASGGSRAESAEPSSLLTRTSTSKNLAELAHGVRLVVSPMLSQIKDEENWATMTNFHATVKPIALMEYLVKLASSEGQTILDPFMGSGTTGIACQNLNRNFIGIEMNEEYFEIARNRINNAVVETLF